MTEFKKKKSILTCPIKWPRPLHWIFGFLFSRKMVRLYLFSAACLITLIIAFYTIENVRAKMAWSKHEKELESQGISTDYKDYIPPETPDDENLAKIPMFAAFEYEREPVANKKYPWDVGGTKWKDKTHGVLPSLSVFHKAPPHKDLTSGMELQGTSLTYGTEEAYGNWIKGTSFDFPFWQIYYRGTHSVDIDLEQSPHKALLEDPEMIKVWERKATKFPFPGIPGIPAKDVEIALKKFDPIWLDLMQATKERSKARFPLEYSELFACLLPHLSHIKSIHQYGKLRASAELHAGDHREGTESICLMLRLVEAMETEPFLISYLVNIASFNIAVHPLWEGTVHHLFDERDLKQISDQLANMTFIPQVKHALGMERAVHIAEIERVSKYRSYFERISHSTELYAQDWPGPWTFQTYIHLAPKGWINRNVLTFSTKLTHLENALNSWTAGNPKAYSQFKKFHESSQNTPITVYNALSRSLEIRHLNTFSKALRIEATVNITKTAVALERYYLKQSTYPKSLSELVPQFLSKVPVDPIDLKPLRYQRLPSKQFKLYSIGANETDDGGEIHKDSNEGDWVWQWPIE